jgi:hypothetical protein
MATVSFPLPPNLCLTSSRAQKRGKLAVAKSGDYVGRRLCGNNLPEGSDVHGCPFCEHYLVLGDKGHKLQAPLSSLSPMIPGIDYKVATALPVVSMYADPDSNR